MSAKLEAMSLHQVIRHSNGHALMYPHGMHQIRRTKSDLQDKMQQYREDVQSRDQLSLVTKQWRHWNA